MMRTALALAFFGGVGVFSAQAPTQQSAPAFEVASVKANLGPEGTQMWGFLPSGRFVATNAQLRLLIQNAYGLSRDRLLGGPGWISTERFDILASAPEGTPEGRMQTMLQTLLADRFKLVLRKEAREMAAYSLILARDDGRIDPALLRASADCDSLRNQSKMMVGKTGQPACSWRVMRHPGTGMRTYQSGGVFLNELANTLSSYVGLPVINDTGLGGVFEFELSWLDSQTSAPALANNGPSLFTALQEQLGLRLVSSRGPIEVLVIDSVERPTPN